MKKLIIILVLALGSLTSFADNCKETKVSEEVLTVLSGVCDKLQVPAEKVWTVVLSAQVTKGVLDLIYSLVIFTMLIVFSKKSIKEYNIDEDSFKFYFCLIVTIVFAVFTVAYIFVSYSAIVQILNPEYGAFDEIVRTIRNMK